MSASCWRCQAKSGIEFRREHQPDDFCFKRERMPAASETVKRTVHVMKLIQLPPNVDQYRQG
jgi:hypothetical protein